MPAIDVDLHQAESALTLRLQPRYRQFKRVGVTALNQIARLAVRDRWITLSIANDAMMRLSGPRFALSAPRTQKIENTSAFRSLGTQVDSPGTSSSQMRPGATSARG